MGFSQYEIFLNKFLLRWKITRVVTVSHRGFPQSKKTPPSRRRCFLRNPPFWAQRNQNFQKRSRERVLKKKPKRPRCMGGGALIWVQVIIKGTHFLDLGEAKFAPPPKPHVARMRYLKRSSSKSRVLTPWFPQKVPLTCLYWKKEFFHPIFFYKMAFFGNFWDIFGENGKWGKSDLGEAKFAPPPKPHVVRMRYLKRSSSKPRVLRYWFPQKVLLTCLYWKNDPYFFINVNSVPFIMTSAHIWTDICSTDEYSHHSVQRGNALPRYVLRARLLRSTKIFIEGTAAPWTNMASQHRRNLEWAHGCSTYEYSDHSIQRGNALPRYVLRARHCTILLIDMWLCERIFL